MPYLCCIINCPNSVLNPNRKSFTFHRFPKDEALLSKWVTNINRKNFVPTKHTRVCSMHFDPYTSYNINEEKTTGAKKQGKFLRADAIPMLFDNGPPILKKMHELGSVKLKKKKLRIEVKEQFLYDPGLLKEIDWNEDLYKFDPCISPQSPGENLVIRPLSCLDYDKDFPGILKQLTDLGTVSKQDFLNCFQKMKSCRGTYYVTVIEDVSTSKIIGAATLLVEQKFIHSLALKGRIEDVVVSKLYCGKQLRKLLVATLIQLSKRLSCYKLSRDCKESMLMFYSQLGFKVEEGNSNIMVIRFGAPTDYSILYKLLNPLGLLTVGTNESTIKLPKMWQNV